MCCDNINIHEKVNTLCIITENDNLPIRNCLRYEKRRYWNFKFFPNVLRELPRFRSTILQLNNRTIIVEKLVIYTDIGIVKQSISI